MGMFAGASAVAAGVINIFILDVISEIGGKEKQIKQCYSSRFGEGSIYLLI